MAVLAALLDMLEQADLVPLVNLQLAAVRGLVEVAVAALAEQMQIQAVVAVVE